MYSDTYLAQDDVANPPTRLPTESLSVISSPPRLLIPNTERLPLEDPRYTLPVEPQQLKDRSSPLPFSISELYDLLCTPPCFILSSPREERPIFLPREVPWLKCCYSSACVSILLYYTILPFHFQSQPATTSQKSIKCARSLGSGLA